MITKRYQWGEPVVAHFADRRNKRDKPLIRLEFTMRRTLSTVLILLFWLGPLAAILPANAESQLPACCRRHGAHHCEMSDAMASQAARAISGSAPEMSAPARCSSYPGFMLATTGPVEALIASPAPLPVLHETAHSPAALRAAARLSALGAHANRGPPVSSLV